MAEDIIIKKIKGGCFDVHVGNMSTGWVTFDEMLGVVTQLTMPDNRACLRFLKTEEEHRRFKNRYICDVENIEIREHGKDEPYAIISKNDKSIGDQTNETM